MRYLIHVAMRTRVNSRAMATAWAVSTAAKADALAVPLCCYRITFVVVAGDRRGMVKKPALWWSNEPYESNIPNINLVY